MTKRTSALVGAVAIAAAALAGCGSGSSYGWDEIDGADLVTRCEGTTRIYQTWNSGDIAVVPNDPTCAGSGEVQQPTVTVTVTPTEGFTP